MAFRAKQRAVGEQETPICTTVADPTDRPERRAVGSAPMGEDGSRRARVGRFAPQGVSKSSIDLAIRVVGGAGFEQRPLRCKGGSRELAY